MKILVYDDNPDFGGHQTMACHGVEALAADPSIEVVFLFNPANLKLAEYLRGADIPAIAGQAGMPAPRFQRSETDLVLCIQGDIGQSTKAVLAAKRAGIKCISYIAIPHRMVQMGAKLGALRDQINKRFLNKPDRYIAISESMKKILQERGCTKPISVVHNGVPTPPSRITHPASRITIGLLGRIEFNQKQQDFMVQTFCSHPEAFQGCQLVIAGSGPDEDRLRKLVSNKENISLLPWSDDPEALYEKIDLLMLPSRYEGVPLVMLEALARGIPVIGSACDGMLDILPEAWTFEPENPAALAETFSRVRESWQNEIETIQKKVIAKNSLEDFKENFHRAVVQA